MESGYIYHHHSFNRGKTRKYWRCERRGTCNARCITGVDLNNLVVYKCDISQHLHPPDETKVAAKQIVNDIKETARRNPNARPSDVIRQNLDQVDNEEILIRLPEKSTMKRMINFQQNDMRPQIPLNLQDVDIQNPYNRTKTGERFKIFDNGVNPPEPVGRVIIFSTRRNMTFLGRSQTIFVDGTFKSTPNIFLQLYTIHGVVLNNVFPLVYMLSSRKTEDTYTTLYQQLKIYAQHHGINLNFQHVMTDFESANINALRREFPNVSIHGCLFHFGQSLWRQIVNRGLRASFLDVVDTDIREQLLELMALSFVPLDDVAPVFDMLMDDLHESVVDFASYIEATYIRGRPARGRRRATPPLFPPALWNSHDLVLGGHARTNNVVEGFHAKFNQMVHTHHANIWRFIDALKDVQEETEQTIAQVRGGHVNVRPPVNKSYVTNQRRLEQIVQLYQEYKDADDEGDGIRTFLRACAYTLKLHSNPAPAPAPDA